MDILVDTNILLDLIFNRAESSSARALFSKARRNGDRTFFSASAVTDIFYIIRKTLHDIEKVYSAMEDVLEFVSILPVTDRDIQTALYAKWRDFEDCVQFMTALYNGVDYIVTRNNKDFEDTSIPILSPDDYLNLPPQG